MAGRKDPVHLYYSFALEFGICCPGEVGGCETVASAAVEPPLGYHPGCSELLTGDRNPALGQCQVGSLTGAVAS